MENGETVSVRVDMGLPELNGRRIPTTADGEPVVGHVLTANGQSTALADQAMASYKAQKSAMYSQLTAKLYS